MSALGSRVWLAAVLTALLLHGPSAGAVCTGDCNGNGRVTVDELLQGVNIALGAALLGGCSSFDANRDDSVTIDELLAAVNYALDGCPPTATPTPTVEPTPTPTLGVNHAPMIPCFDVYQGFTGQEIQLPIGASDPDGDSLHYTAMSLPDGAQLDENTGMLTWTPTAQQSGPFYIPVTVTDGRSPPAAAQGVLPFQISPSDACLQATCDPATGCQSTLMGLDQTCCGFPSSVRLAEPLADCPYGRALFVGRNSSGFGRLQDCDVLRVINFQQSSASVRFNVEARCVNLQQPQTLEARLDSQCGNSTRLLFDIRKLVTLQMQDNGYAQQLGVSFPVQGKGPFFCLDGAEANLTLTLTDADGVSVSENLRVNLIFTQLPDLPESADVPPPVATCPASMLSTAANFTQ